MKKNKKLLALVCCMALLVGTVGATLAWLTANSGPITNTFTVGDIEITLDEVQVSDDGYGTVVKNEKNEPIRIPVGEDNGNSYKLIPGSTYVKDPKVTVLAGSEACYVFIKVKKSENYDDFLISEVDTSKWTALGNEYPDVYYLEQSSLVGADNGKEYYVFAGNNEYPNGYVTVNNNVTKADLTELSEETYPNIVFTAYAVQQANMTSAVDAWEKAGF